MEEKLINKYDMHFCIKCRKRRLNEDFRTKNVCRDCYNKHSREYQKKIALEDKI